MVRIVFGVLLFGHGLIHLIGFISEWNLGLPSFLKGNTLISLSESAARLAGIMWLVAGSLWLVISILYFLGKDYFWKIAVINLVISQLLIIAYWPYAEFGTIMNVITLAVVMVNIARTNFERRISREWSGLVASARKTAVKQKENSHLPPLINNWLLATKGTQMIPSRVIVTQQGSMRSKPAGPWMSFNATQHYTVDPPGFIWSSQIEAAHMITIAGRDKFEDGKGNMIIKPLYLYKIADTSGPEMDQGTMLRFMGELIWFPEAATMDYFRWEKINSTSAAVTMTFNGTTAKGVFTFDDNGLVKSFSAERFGNFDGQFRKEMWEVRVIEHREINGHLIGNKCEVTWNLKEGDFTWLKLEVNDVSYEFK